MLEIIPEKNYAKLFIKKPQSKDDRNEFRAISICSFSRYLSRGPSVQVLQVSYDVRRVTREHHVFDLECLKVHLQEMHVEK